MIFSAWVATLVRVQNLSKTAFDFGKNGAFFNHKTMFFVKRENLLSKLITFKYENIKLKKKNVKRNMPNI
jgi:hypothetical protein